MNKLSKKLVILGLLSAIGLSGCASVSGVGNKMVNNRQEGIIFGFAGVDNEITAKDFCDATNNKDYRCANSSDYVSVYVFSKFGFSDGAVGINALVRKDFPNLDKLKHKMGTGNKNMPYVKAKVVAGQLGEVLEIVSINGDGKCYWSGMPRAGGTVCPTFNYDYRKDFIGVVFR